MRDTALCVPHPGMSGLHPRSEWRVVRHCIKESRQPNEAADSEWEPLGMAHGPGVFFCLPVMEFSLLHMDHSRRRASGASGGLEQNHSCLEV